MIIKNGEKKYEYRMVANDKKKGDKSPDFYCFFDIPGTVNKNGECKQLKVSLWKHTSKDGKEYYVGSEMIEKQGK